MFDIDFEWPVAQTYESGGAPAYRYPDTWAVYPTKGPVTWRRPLGSEPPLYLQFLRLDGSEQSCLEFAKKYGLLRFDIAQDSGWSEPLTGWGSAAYKWCEHMDFWRREIQRIRNLQSILEGTRTHPTEVFRRERFGLSAPLAVSLVMTPKGPPMIHLRCGTLLDAIELQCVRSFLAGRGSYQCAECSSWFEVGPGAHRSHAVFCSRTCKDHHHNRLKAEKAKATKAKVMREHLQGGAGR